MDTSCKQCVFAGYQGIRLGLNEPAYRNQVSCGVGRLEQFKKVGANIEQKTEDNTTHYLIKDRVCNMCTQERSLEGINISDWKETVEKRISVKCNMTVYVGKKDTFDDAKTTIDSILAQTLSPFEIKVILHGDHDTGEYVLYLQEHAKGICEWSVDDIQIDSLNYYSVLDTALTKLRSMFIGVSKAGYVYPSNYIATINKAINVNLQRFVCLLPDENDNALLVQHSLCKMIGNNRGQPLLSKIKQIAEEEGTQHMVKRFEEL